MHRYFLLFGTFLILLSSLAFAAGEVQVQEKDALALETRSTTLKPLGEKTPVQREELLQRYFELLRHKDLNYGNVGSVLEGLVLESFTRRYPSDSFEVLSGLQYFNAEGNTLGELDLIVIHRETHDVILVGEVKLSRALDRALEKATEQVERFRKALASDQIAQLSLPAEPSRDWNLDHFRNISRFLRVGSAGAVEVGFDYEVDITREEGDIVQAMLLQYSH